jgi:hypothetical protein
LISTNVHRVDLIQDALTQLGQALPKRIAMAGWRTRRAKPAIESEESHALPDGSPIPTRRARFDVALFDDFGVVRLYRLDALGA